MWMQIIVSFTGVSLRIHSHSRNRYRVAFQQLNSVHLFYCSFGIFDIFELNKCKSFTFASLRVSVNVYILDLSKRPENLLQLALRHISQFSLQTSNLNFGKFLLLFSLLLIRVHLLCHFHLPNLYAKLLCCSCCSVLLSLGMLDPKTCEFSSFHLNGSLFHCQGFLHWLRRIKLYVCDSFALSTSLIPNDSNVSDFSTFCFTEKVPYVFFLSFQW